MSAKPPVSVRRPGRPAEDPTREAPRSIAPAAVPNLDLDGRDALAFTLRGRPAADMEPPTVVQAPQPAVPLAALQSAVEHPFGLIHDASSVAPRPAQHLRAVGEGYPALVVHELPPAAEAEGGDYRHVAVKLPPTVGRQLSEIADRRGSKRTHVALEALAGPLHALAAAHRAGEFPSIQKVSAGSVRSSIALILPPEVADDLRLVVQARRAVRAQILVRLLVPAIEELHAREVRGP
jgi:hypothetical protein